MKIVSIFLVRVFKHQRHAHMQSEGGRGMEGGDKEGVGSGQRSINAIVHIVKAFLTRRARAY